MKGWREYLKGIIIKFIKISYSFIKWVFHYFGLEFIYRKFNPSKDPQPLPTGVIWIVGIYVAFFGVASQRYENRIDIIENRANSIFAQLAVPSVQKKALSRISRVQNMACPYKPNILNPHSVFISLFRDSKYEEMVEQLKETVEDWKGSLDSVDLRGAKLRSADLGSADLAGADLTGADLEKANLQKANLAGADLGGADLQKANLRSANLVKAKLGSADLAGADLQGANLYRADLQKANLRSADLGGADLQKANLRSANLVKAKLWFADLEHAKLWFADLQGADLYRAKLWEANLRETDLRGALLWFADLKGAKPLTVEQLCKTSTLYQAKLDQEIEMLIKQECPGLLKVPKRIARNKKEETNKNKETDSTP